MKLRALIAAATLMGGLIATSAQATTYDLTELLNYSDNGFRSSLIHGQQYDAMNGYPYVFFNPEITDGTFDSDTGAIAFDGSITNWGLSSAYTAVGELTESTRTNGLFGWITFSFLGDLLNKETLTFSFADQNFTSGSEPNGYASDRGRDFIALWGDTGLFSDKSCGQGYCFGIDLRIAYEEVDDGGVSPVPLPASMVFLLAGLGGLGLTRKLGRKA